MPTFIRKKQKQKKKKNNLKSFNIKDYTIFLPNIFIIKEIGIYSRVMALILQSEIPILTKRNYIVTII